MILKVLFIGDIVGKVGRQAVAHFLPPLLAKHDFELIIANAENATHGRGLSKKHHDELLALGINVLTLGNHYNDRPEIKNYIQTSNALVRPFNTLEAFPGKGSIVYTSKNGYKFRITNICCEVFMAKEWLNPHLAMEKVLLHANSDEIHIVDLHGEATAEKKAFGYHFATRVSAILGTHTHVQTRDYRLLNNFTAYISDVGMCGPYNSIIGFEPQSVINKMWFDSTNNARFTLNNKDKGLFSAVIVEINSATHEALRITPLYLVEE